jgi:hypothetical protein
MSYAGSGGVNLPDTANGPEEIGLAAAGSDLILANAKLNMLWAALGMVLRRRRGCQRVLRESKGFPPDHGQEQLLENQLLVIM